EIQLDQQSGGDDHYGRIGNKARAERQQQGTHGPLPVGKITVTSPPEARAGDIIRVKPVSFVRALDLEIPAPLPHPAGDWPLFPRNRERQAAGAGVSGRNARIPGARGAILRPCRGVCSTSMKTELCCAANRMRPASLWRTTNVL